MPDAVEAARQDMDQKAADELVRRQRHDLLAFGPVAAIVSHEGFHVKAWHHGDIVHFQVRYGIQIRARLHDTARRPSLINLTSGRHSKRLHHYPAFGGQGLRRTRPIL
jgi:hypothetical protein